MRILLLSLLLGGCASECHRVGKVTVTQDEGQAAWAPYTGWLGNRWLLMCDDGDLRWEEVKPASPAPKGREG